MANWCHNSGELERADGSTEAANRLGTWLTMSTNTSRSTLYAAITALGLVGVVTPFLPFTFFDTSPLYAVKTLVKPDYGSKIYLLGGPFFLAILVSIASIRLVVFGKPRRSELAIAYCASIVMACATLLTASFGIFEANQPIEWYSIALACTTILVGGRLVLTSWRKGVASGLIAVAGMQAAYVANALFCLILSYGDWLIGAKLTLVTVTVYIAQMLFVVFRGE